MKSLLLFSTFAVLLVLIEVQEANCRAASTGDQYVSRPISKRNYKRIFKENQNVFVKFFTNWCFYSKKIFDTWENLGEHYAYNSTILIGEIDCEDNKSLCGSFKVHEYPTFIMFKDGVKYEKYVGKRTLEDFTNYVDNFLSNEEVIKDET